MKAVEIESRQYSVNELHKGGQVPVAEFFVEVEWYRGAAAVSCLLQAWICQQLFFFFELFFFQASSTSPLSFRVQANCGSMNS